MTVDEFFDLISEARAEAPFSWEALEAEIQLIGHPCSFVRVSITDYGQRPPAQAHRLVSLSEIKQAKGNAIAQAVRDAKQEQDKLIRGDMDKFYARVEAQCEALRNAPQMPSEELGQIVSADRAIEPKTPLKELGQSGVVSDEMVEAARSVILNVDEGTVLTDAEARSILAAALPHAPTEADIRADAQRIALDAITVEKFGSGVTLIREQIRSAYLSQGEG